jgi:hypothetical protein
MYKCKVDGCDRRIKLSYFDEAVSAAASSGGADLRPAGWYFVPHLALNTTEYTAGNSTYVHAHSHHTHTTPRDVVGISAGAGVVGSRYCGGRDIEVRQNCQNVRQKCQVILQLVGWYMRPMSTYKVMLRNFGPSSEIPSSLEIAAYKRKERPQRLKQLTFRDTSSGMLDCDHLPQGAEWTCYELISK